MPSLFDADLAPSRPPPGVYARGKHTEDVAKLQLSRLAGPPRYSSLECCFLGVTPFILYANTRLCIRSSHTCTYRRCEYRTSSKLQLYSIAGAAPRVVVHQLRAFVNLPPSLTGVPEVDNSKRRLAQLRRMLCYFCGRAHIDSKPLYPERGRHQTAVEELLTKAGLAGPPRMPTRAICGAWLAARAGAPLLCCRIPWCLFTYLLLFQCAIMSVLPDPQVYSSGRRFAERLHRCRVRSTFEAVCHVLFRANVAPDLTCFPPCPARGHPVERAQARRQRRARRRGRTRGGAGGFRGGGGHACPAGRSSRCSGCAIWSRKQLHPRCRLQQRRWC